MSDLLGMHRAVLRSSRSATEKMVSLAIIDHWSEASPEPWPSVPTLSKLCSFLADGTSPPRGPEGSQEVPVNPPIFASR
jgi:hypothetical protein